MKALIQRVLSASVSINDEKISEIDVGLLIFLGVTRNDKEKDIRNAPCGMIGLESAFGLVNKELSKEKLNIKSILDLFIVKPSKIINVKANLIKEGEIAELNVIDPKIKWIFRKDHIKSKSMNSPIVGKKLQGKVLITINKGFISPCKFK